VKSAVKSAVQSAVKGAVNLPRSRFLRSKRGVAVLAILLLVLFLFRPAVYHLRTRIANSIGRALGRRITLENVRLRVLPRPGFDLEGLVIYDAPAFSAEPMIRAEEVSAAIRLTSLLRGRLEIATLSATEPSINLVRNEQGRWNLASLIERNAQIPAAPTAKRASERRPAFPYLEATGARINFKIGQTKKSYALMDADVALWQESENSWGARLKAAPVRTDFHLTDTGIVQVNATWQRAPTLRLTPLQLAVQWHYGQLGQITQLLSGKDRGWRGGLNFTANISGTPEALQIKSQASIEDLRRYDIVGTESVRLASGCSGEYNAMTSELADLLCDSPIGGGRVRLRGVLSLASESPTYDLTLDVAKVPLTSVARLLRQAKKQIPSDLTASGLLNAEFSAKRHTHQTANDASSLFPPDAWTGSGSATNVILSSNARHDVIALGTIPLALVANDAGPPTVMSAKTVTNLLRTRRYLAPQKNSEVSDHRLQLGPSTLAVNGSAPLSADGWISTSGYLFSLRGDDELQDLFRLERVLGLPVAHPAAEGSAKLNVSISGAWQGFAPASTLGTVQLRNVRAETRGLNTPIQISAASISLTADALSMQKISARTGNTHWSGGVTAPRHCVMANTAADNSFGTGPGVVPNCIFQFDLTADQLSAADLAEWFTPHPAKHPWYRILNSSSDSIDAPGSSPLLAVQAQGNLHIGRFALKKVIATQIATHVDVDRGKIALTMLRAQMLQGTHQGNWTIDVSNRGISDHAVLNQAAASRDASMLGIRYHGTGTLRDISLPQVATVMNDDWITGMADGTFDVDGSSDSFRALLTSSVGTLQFVMRNGTFPHIDLPESPAPFPVHRFSGDLRLKKGEWELSSGKLESRDGIYQVSGTASASQNCDFLLTRGDDRSWELTGTLTAPSVAPANGAVAKRAEATADKPQD
jgi:uncharacterized protein involved in outer membrane biogenesis